MKKIVLILFCFVFYSCDISTVFDDISNFFGDDGSKDNLVSLNSIPSINDSEIKKLNDLNEDSEFLVLEDNNSNNMEVVADNTNKKKDETVNVNNIVGLKNNNNDNNNDNNKVDNNDTIRNDNFSRGNNTDISEARAKDNEFLAENKTMNTRKTHKSRDGDFRKFLLKGQFREVAHKKVNVGDIKNLYYKSIGTFNFSRTLKNEKEKLKYAILADKRFNRISKDKKMKGLRVRSILWLGINGYINFIDERSIDELVYPFDYILNNFGKTRYGNDAIFYKMLVFYKKNEIELANEMFKKLDEYNGKDLIYDIDHNKWAEKDKIKKYYGKLFKRVDGLGNKRPQNSIGVKKLVQSPNLTQKKQLKKNKNVVFEFGNLDEEEKKIINKSLKKEVSTKDDELFVLSDKEITKEILKKPDDIVKNEKNKEVILNDNLENKNDDNVDIEVNVKKPVEDKSKSEKNEVLNDSEMQKKKEKDVVKETKVVDTSINNMIKEMDDIVGGY